jgi:hypothetical protein
MTKLINVLKFFFSNEREIAPGVFWLGGTLFENRNPPKGQRPLKFKKYMKPEFPKARLIREDFLPEREQMNNYRIKKITKGDGTVWYQPQKKVLWFWKDLGLTGIFSVKEWANAAILEDFQKSQKDKVEYLEYDTSQTVPPEPNPPPKVP